MTINKNVPGVVLIPNYPMQCTVVFCDLTTPIYVNYLYFQLQLNKIYVMSASVYKYIIWLKNDRITISIL